jgi:inner membrane transporter RhtA
VSRLVSDTNCSATSHRVAVCVCTYSGEQELLSTRSKAEAATGGYPGKIPITHFYAKGPTWDASALRAASRECSKPLASGATMLHNELRRALKSAISGSRHQTLDHRQLSPETDACVAGPAMNGKKKRLRTRRSGGYQLRNVGPVLCLGAMTIMQFGMALSVSIVSSVGPVHASFLRFAVAAALIVVIVLASEPKSLIKSISGSSIALGVCMAGMGIFFAMAIMRMPLALATAVEFLGPLSVAVLAGGRFRHALIAVVALSGVLLALSVHTASLSPSAIFPACAAAACWAGYILASRRVGSTTRGLHGLAVPLSIAAVLSWAASWFERSTGGLGVASSVSLVAVAVAYPLLPYVLEMAALRRSSSHRFGILTSGEPVVALGRRAGYAGTVSGALAGCGHPSYRRC